MAQPLAAPAPLPEESFEAPKALTNVLTCSADDENTLLSPVEMPRLIRPQKMKKAMRPGKPRTRRRLAQKYSFIFLGGVLLVLCCWHAMAGKATGDGASRQEAEGVEGRRLADPPDALTLDQRRKGALILHAIGLFYMFIGIAIVCDECFVPALEVIVDQLQLSNDVAGATFMAAGGSAPEFFTSLIGSIFVKSDIGTGTIIGSAVFNVLFVIGACAVAAKEPILLTWFPLFRDSCFYAIDLMVIVAVFLDEEVRWWEALILFSLYVAYGTFMKYSQKIEEWIQQRNEMAADANARPPDDSEAWAAPRSDSPGPHGAGGRGQAGTGEGVHVDPTSAMETRRASVGKSSFEDKTQFKHKSHRASHIHHQKIVITQKSGVLDSTGGSSNDGLCMDGLPGQAMPIIPHPAPYGVSPPQSAPPEHLDVWKVTNLSDVPAPNSEAAAESDKDSDGAINLPDDTKKKPVEIGDSDDGKDGDGDGDDDEEGNEPLSLAFPGAEASRSDWVWYVISFPIVFCLVFTIPDVRREGYRKYFVMTFAMSICWIAAFTWVMVWFATVIAETFGLSDVIMGLTILAAGTSVPDLITSMIVAREGFGDMAVSSSIGSNIFDVTVGLPVPWLVYGAVHGEPVAIKNEGLEISVMLLLAMLGATIGAIMIHGWKMTRLMGASLLLLYLLFEVVAVGLTFAPEGSLKLINV